MTTAHNIVVAPGPAFARPSGGGGPTVMTNHGRSGRCSGPRRSGKSCLPNSGAHGTTEANAWCPTRSQAPPIRWRRTPLKSRTSSTAKAHLQAIRRKEPPPSGRGRARDKGRCTSCGGPAAAAARHDGRPSRVRPSGEDQQHGGSPERQTTLRQMQPEPSPAVPEAGSAKGPRGSALGPIGRMLQHHQDQPASPLCRMLRRRRRQSVCSGHAAHHHRSGHRREKKK